MRRITRHVFVFAVFCAFVLLSLFRLPCLRVDISYADSQMEQREPFLTHPINRRHPFESVPLTGISMTPSNMMALMPEPPDYTNIADPATPSSADLYASLQALRVVFNLRWLLWARGVTWKAPTPTAARPLPSKAVEETESPPSSTTAPLYVLPEQMLLQQIMATESMERLQPLPEEYRTPPGSRTFVDPEHLFAINSSFRTKGWRLFDLPRTTATAHPRYGWSKFYLAVNLYKNEAVVPFLTGALVAFLEDEVAPFYNLSTSVVVAIYANHALRDETSTLIQYYLVPYLQKVGVRAVFATVRGTCLGTRFRRMQERIEWMACVRNKALGPLYDLGMNLFIDDTSDDYIGTAASDAAAAAMEDQLVVLFFNDVFFRPRDITTLLESEVEPIIAQRTRPDGFVRLDTAEPSPSSSSASSFSTGAAGGGERESTRQDGGVGTTFDMACGMDFYYSFYDTWVSRDRHGQAFLPQMPYTDEVETRNALHRILVHGAQGDAVGDGRANGRHYAVPVKACWNGVAAIRGSLFLPPPPSRRLGFPEAMRQPQTDEVDTIHASLERQQRERQFAARKAKMHALQLETPEYGRRDVAIAAAPAEGNANDSITSPTTTGSVGPSDVPGEVTAVPTIAPIADWTVVLRDLEGSYRHMDEERFARTYPSIRLPSGTIYDVADQVAFLNVIKHHYSRVMLRRLVARRLLWNSLRAKMADKLAVPYEPRGPDEMAQNFSAVLDEWRGQKWDTPAPETQPPRRFTPRPVRLGDTLEQVAAAIIPSTHSTAPATSRVAKPLAAGTTVLTHSSAATATPSPSEPPVYLPPGGVYYRARYPALRFRHSFVPSYGATVENRDHVDDEVCLSSECLLVCEDIAHVTMLQSRRVPVILMNPNVRVAYEPAHFARVTSSWIYSSPTVFRVMALRREWRQRWARAGWLGVLTMVRSAFSNAAHDSQPSRDGGTADLSPNEDVVRDEGFGDIGIVGRVATSSTDDWTMGDPQRTVRVSLPVSPAAAGSLAAAGAVPPVAIVNVSQLTRMMCFLPASDSSEQFFGSAWYYVHILLAVFLGRTLIIDLRRGVLQKQRQRRTMGVPSIAPPATRSLRPTSTAAVDTNSNSGRGSSAYNTPGAVGSLDVAIHMKEEDGTPALQFAAASSSATASSSLSPEERCWVLTGQRLAPLVWRVRRAVTHPTWGMASTVVRSARDRRASGLPLAGSSTGGSTAGTMNRSPTPPAARRVWQPVFGSETDALRYVGGDGVSGADTNSAVYGSEEDEQEDSLRHRRQRASLPRRALRFVLRVLHRTIQWIGSALFWVCCGGDIDVDAHGGAANTVHSNSGSLRERVLGGSLLRSTPPPVPTVLGGSLGMNGSQVSGPGSSTRMEGHEGTADGDAVPSVSSVNYPVRFVETPASSPTVRNGIREPAWLMSTGGGYNNLPVAQPQQPQTAVYGGDDAAAAVRARTARSQPPAASSSSANYTTGPATIVSSPVTAPVTEEYPSLAGYDTTARVLSSPSPATMPTTATTTTTWVVPTGSASSSTGYGTPLGVYRRTAAMVASSSGGGAVASVYPSSQGATAVGTAAQRPGSPSSSTAPTGGGGSTTPLVTSTATASSSALPVSGSAVGTGGEGTSAASTWRDALGLGRFRS